MRVCDNGGWTDTWFAGGGQVFNIAVTPCVEVDVVVTPGPPAPSDHPLVRAALEEMGPPEDVTLDFAISSVVPAGSSTGTSAALGVALIGALAYLRGRVLSAAEVAARAHAIEVERLGLQSGVQDQQAAAHGGINYMEIHEYPHVEVHRLPVPDEVWWELERRLTLVYLGRPHVSSAVHERVISELELGDARSRLAPLREAATRSRDAVVAGDLEALGSAMIDNTEAQARLHPGLVSAQAQALIDVARSLGAAGWKVNGAGGEGGSLTLLAGPAPGAGRHLVAALCQADPAVQPIPIALDRQGLRVWESAAGSQGVPR